MTLREFFTGRAVVFSILLLLGIFVFGYKAFFSPKGNTNIPQSSEEEHMGPPLLAWTYENDDSLNPDGLPNTNIFLQATYSSGTVETQFVDTTPGGCGAIPDADTDSVPQSTNIQCYGAGLGYRYKIIEGEASYLVVRKTFEEALPDYNPPVYEYEVVASLPLAK